MNESAVKERRPGPAPGEGIPPPGPGAAFVHLHLHTEYSLSDGIVRVDALAAGAAAAGMPAVAVTEAGNLFSLVKFYREASRRGVKPLAGAELRVAGDSAGGEPGILVLLCQDSAGYRNLTRLISRSYLEGQAQGTPLVRREWLDRESCAGLIALSGARDGDVGQALVNGNPELARTRLAEWLALFPDRYYLELQRTRRPHEDLYIEGAVRLAEDLGVPVVATNDVRFLNAGDFEVHEARVCIHEGWTLGDARRPRRYSPEQYLKSGAQMAELFADIPEAIENAALIALRCNLELELGKYFLPDFPVPAGFDQDSWLRHEAEAGLERLKAAGAVPAAAADSYRDRLHMELDVIISMGFSGYFLIVADFIRWAKARDIPVGPGRGSGAGSLVAYALGITELDPLRYDLLFERFLNPERVSLPDFDVDFCMDRRDEVIDYVADRYGRDRVSQIITYGTMAAKAVVRDVGRVLNHPYGFVDKIAKLIPFELNMTLDRALEEEEALRSRYEQEEEVRAIIDLARELEGLSRNAGRHAGGIVIAPRPLTEYMPLYCDQGGGAVTQFDMGDVEAIGLVKFDFLGLRTLTIIDRAVKDINRAAAVGDAAATVDIGRIPLDDAATYALIQRTDTAAIFQLESDGMRKLIRRLKPDSFDDLIALVALFRPGPLQSGMVDDYIQRKHGARVQYPHPALEEILRPSYGVILYQEQVMQIAQVLAGYTLGAADLLRRAMGKKKPEEMAQQRSIFVEGARARGVDEKQAAGIFDLMEKFAGYGFNKSHSAAYALLAYQTAWLKAHYPAAFMAAVLSADMDSTDKIVMLRDEVRRMGLSLLPPSLNESGFRFEVVDAGTIRFGLGAIKGVGASAIDAIIGEREANGRFTDLFDLARRVDARRVNKRVLEALIRSGAADGLGPGRSSLMASVDRALQLASQHSSNSSTGQEDLFGLGGPVLPGRAEADSFERAEPWSDQERLRGEKETLGFYLEGHPADRYAAELACIISTRLQDLRPGRVTVAGFIDRMRIRSGQRGRMAELWLDDGSARAMVTLYSEDYERFRNLIIKDHLVVVRGDAVLDEYLDSGCSVTGREVFTLDQVRARNTQLRLLLDGTQLHNGVLGGLQEILSRHRAGTSGVAIEYNGGAARGVLCAGEQWKVAITDRLLDELRKLLGEANVSVHYSRGESGARHAGPAGSH